MLRHFWISPYTLEDIDIATIVSSMQNLALNEIK